MATNYLIPDQISSCSPKGCFVMTKDGSIWFGEFKFIRGVETFVWKKVPAIVEEKPDPPSF